jgi:hypothetical protein
LLAVDDDTELPGGEQSFDAVVEQYVAEMSRLAQGTLSTDADWAAERLGHMAWLGQLAEVWKILLAAIDRIDDESVLCQVGAGELEGLIDAYPSVMEGIERLVPENARLVAALTCAWVTREPAKSSLAVLLRPRWLVPRVQWS